MKILIPAFILLIISLKSSAQRFQQYNTGTLYGSYENPSQAAFIPDSSRQFASNFIIPNVGAASYLQGNAQATLKSRLFLGNYDNAALTIGQGNYNNVYANVNVYAFMFKAFTNLNGRQEIGVSFQTRANGRGNISDETIALFNGIEKFKQDKYTDIFNGNAFYEVFNQLSTTYREKVTRHLAVGIKVSLLSGIAYQRLSINQSSIQFNGQGDYADWALRGRFQTTFDPGSFAKRSFLPLFKNPGAAISMGFTALAPGGLIVQTNLKDLGFIKWKHTTTTYDFAPDLNGPARIYGLSTPQREENVINSLSGFIQERPTTSSFTKNIVGYAEVSVAKKFGFTDVVYTPTIIASKQLFSTNLGGAFLNQVQFKNVSATLSGIYDHKLFDVGLQLMYKSPNVDFYVGSEELTKTLNMAKASNKNQSAISSAMPFSGAGVYLGFSLKFGRLIERWRNESFRTTGGEQGPLGRAWNRAFTPR